MRTEFGAERTSCVCRECQTNCRFMPGFLIPADLDRMIPGDADPFAWAEMNLLASPGAIVARGLDIFRISTLVPATKQDGSCVNLIGGKRNGRCAIWENAPFGCAFFDCTSTGRSAERLSAQGLVEIHNAGPESLYHRLWRHLDAMGKRQLAPEVLRDRMRAALTGRRNG